MAEGFDVRDVVQDSNQPSGRANQPARQISGIGVSAPRGGDMSQVGREQEVLAQTLQMGGAALQKYADKADAEDLLFGQMQYMQGRTEAELVKAGVNPTTIKGYRGLKMKTAANEWFSTEAGNLDPSVSPEDYRTKLQTQFRTLTDQVDPDDHDTLSLLTETSSDMFSKLVTQQTLKHVEWAKTQGNLSASRLLASESETGDDASMHEVNDSLHELVPNASPEDLKDIRAQSVRETLEKGNFKVFNMMGGIEGLKTKYQMSEEQIDGISASLKKGQTMNETNYMADIDTRENKIMLDLKGGSITGPEARKQLDALQKEFNTSPEFIRSVANKIQTEEFAQGATKQEIDTLSNPAYIQAMEDLQRKTRWGASNTPEAMAGTAKIAADFKLTPEFTRKAYESTISARNEFVNKQDQKLAERSKEIDDQVKVDTKATALLNSNFANAGDYDKKVVSAAFEMQRRKIAQDVQTDPRFQSDDEREAEMIRQHVAFLRDVPVMDDQLKGGFTASLQGSPVDDKGTLRPDAKSAFMYVKEMRTAGISERKIKEYVGEGYPYLNSALEIGTGVTDPKTALIQSYNMTELGKAPPKPISDPVVMIGKYEKDKTKFFNNLEPSMITAWLGADGGSQYDQVLSYQVAEAAKNSPEMDAWMKNRITALANANPNMNSTAVMSLAHKDMAKFEYVLGNMVGPMDGGTKSLSEAMGVENEPGALVSNAAVLTFLANHGETMWPKGTEERDWWTRLKDGATTVGDHALFMPKDVQELLGTHNTSLLAFSEKQQRLANDIKFVNIQPGPQGKMYVQLYADGDRNRPVGMPQLVDAKMVGMEYKANAKATRIEKNLKPAVTKAEEDTLKVAPLTESDKGEAKVDKAAEGPSVLESIGMTIHDLIGGAKPSPKEDQSLLDTVSPTIKKLVDKGVPPAKIKSAIAGYYAAFDDKGVLDNPGTADTRGQYVPRQGRRTGMANKSELNDLLSKL